jgi:di/tricarboxylate transporter
MEKGHGYFEDSHGNKSSSRMIGVLVVCYALLLATAVLVFGFMEKTTVMLSAAAAGTIFTTIGGPGLVYLFTNKGLEKKIDQPIKP